MASAFAHAVIAIAAGKSFPKRNTSWKFWFLGIVCTILPDADVISFKLGIPYEHVLGHRGFSHSLIFSLVLGVIIKLLFYKNVKLISLKSLGYILFFTLCTASHGVLDALTNGGLGVAFFAPFDNTRYFFPWRPIQVSPIGFKTFFSERGLNVIKSEILWIGIPCICYILFIAIIKKIRRKKIGT